MPKTWSAKQERQYKHIKKSCIRKRCKRGRGVCLTECKRIAAATVNKMRIAGTGSTRRKRVKTRAKRGLGCGCGEPLKAK